MFIWNITHDGKSEQCSVIDNDVIVAGQHMSGNQRVCGYCGRPLNLYEECDCEHFYWPSKQMRQIVAGKTPRGVKAVAYKLHWTQEGENDL